VFNRSFSSLIANKLFAVEVNNDFLSFFHNATFNILNFYKGSFVFIYELLSSFMNFMPTNSSGFWAVETAREGHLTWIELKFTCDKLKLNLNVTQNKAICINSLNNNNNNILFSSY